MSAETPYRPGGGFVEVADRVYAGRYPQWDTTIGVVHGSDGLLVVDTRAAYTAGVELREDVRRLAPGVRIRWVVNTHEHFDHAAGLAEIKKAAPGLKFYASAADGAIIAAGGKGDPFLTGPRFEYEPVKPDVTIKDGDKVSLGGVTLTAHITGGHTKGCTTWTFPVTIAGKVRQALDLCSASVLPGYKLGKTETYPGQTDDYRKSFATWRALPCEVFIASHGGFYGMKAKKAALESGKADAFVDPAGCKAFVDRAEAAFQAEFKKQNP